MTILTTRRLRLEPFDLTHVEGLNVINSDPEVMRYLTLRQNEAVARVELLNDVWGITHDGGGNVVDVIVASLRKKLGTSASVIETVHGHGYMYRSPRLLSGNAEADAAVGQQSSRTAGPIRTGLRARSKI